jgi:hypothetical protein
MSWGRLVPVLTDSLQCRGMAYSEGLVRLIWLSPDVPELINPTDPTMLILDI